MAGYKHLTYDEVIRMREGKLHPREQAVFERMPEAFPADGDV